MKRELHPTQKRLLQLLKDNISDPLTVRELKDVLNVSSVSVVQHHIVQLEKRGFLRRNPANPHDYQVLSEEPEKAITYLNLYGLAQCGPGGSILDGNLIDRVPLATKIVGFSSAEAFLVKARGDSMSPTIRDKDLVIVRRVTHADNGDIVVCVNNGEALIKKIKIGNDGIILRSINDKRFDPFLAAEDFRVEGVVKGVISYLRNKVD